MRTYALTDDDCERIRFALMAHANFIETGNPVLTEGDVAAITMASGKAPRLRLLSAEQREEVAALRALAARFQSC